MTRLAALLLSVCLLAACTGEPADDRPASTSTPSPAPQPRPDTPAPEPALPDVPADRPARLAGQLDLAFATLRDEDAAPQDVRRAGEFQQLALRSLGRADPRQTREVTAQLSPQAALVVRSGARAARELDSLTEPQPRLPQWRIVAPEPPEQLLRHYRAAERRLGVPWSYLAAIHLVETRMGRIRGTSTAGAQGPMQFIPATWARYGAGGDITDPQDAILAAARLLRANGAPADMAGALWHYNPSEHYVRAVSEYAHTLQRAPWAYRGYWHWRVLYKQVRGTYALEIGYPDTRPSLVPGG